MTVKASLELKTIIHKINRTYSILVWVWLKNRKYLPFEKEGQSMPRICSYLKVYLSVLLSQETFPNKNSFNTDIVLWPSMAAFKWRRSWEFSSDPNLSSNWDFGSFAGAPWISVQITDWTETWVNRTQTWIGLKFWCGLSNSTENLR